MPTGAGDRKRVATAAGIGAGLYFFVSFCVAALDQITKYFALARLCAGDSIPVVPGVFHITLVLNEGIAFGLFKNTLLIPVLVALAVALFIINFFIFFAARSGRLVKLSLSFILGGCVGNAIDRLRLGAVVDFLDFRIWPVFNIADSFVCIGMFLLFFCIVKKHRIKE